MMSEFIDIPGSKTWTTVTLINKGWSSDKKYYIKTNDKCEFLLRISDISTFDRKKEEYDVMRMLDPIDILMSRPIDFGTFNSGEKVYTLLTWLQGDDAQLKISSLPPKKQYELGYKAGNTLRKIHQIAAPPHIEDWAVSFNKKVDEKIRSYKECELKLEKAYRIIDYINENRFLLEGRPQTFQHGDFHIGNMILTRDNEIGIIDFNRYSYGDPWEEFNRIVWCAETSEYFASGRINGYFQEDVPEEFFRLLALYTGSNTLSSIPWSIPFGEPEITTILNQARKVLYWYDDFSSIIPKWYIPYYKI